MLSGVTRQGVPVPGPNMPPQMTSPMAPVVGQPAGQDVVDTFSTAITESATGSPPMPGGGVPVIGIPNSMDYPRLAFYAPYFGITTIDALAGGPFLQLSGGTMTGPLDPWRIYSVGSAAISASFPTRGIYEEYNITGTALGSNGAMWFFGVNDTLNVGAGNFWIPFYITHNFDASVGTGNRNAFETQITVSNGTPLTEYVSAQFNATLNSGSGQVFGLNPYVLIAAAAASSAEAVGTEIDTDVRTNVTRKVGLQIVDVATSTGIGTTALDAGLLMARASGASGYAAGIQFGEWIGGGPVGSSSPLRPTSTVLKVWPGTGVSGQPAFANGIDFSGLPISGNAFASPGFTVNGGNGAITTSENVAAPPPGAAQQIYVVGADNTSPTVSLDCFGTPAAPFLQGRSARGTAASPSVLQNGDFLLGMRGQGRGASAYGSVNGATILMQASENWTDAAQGSSIALGTTENGTTIGVNSLVLQGYTATFSAGATVSNVAGFGRFNANGGYGTQTGLGGTTDGHVFNLSWGAAGPFHLWVDNADQGSINVTPCDIRLKKNVVPATHDALAAINAVELKEFDFLETSVSPERHERIGFTAQQLIEAIPEAVYPKDDPDAMWSVQLTPIVSYLIGAVQQLSQRVAELEAAR